MYVYMRVAKNGNYFKKDKINLNKFIFIKYQFVLFNNSEQKVQGLV